MLTAATSRRYARRTGSRCGSRTWSDITAARLHALPALHHAAAAGLPTLADPGYDGAGIGILIPVKQPVGGRALDVNTRTRKRHPAVPALPGRTRVRSA